MSAPDDPPALNSVPPNLDSTDRPRAEHEPPRVLASQDLFLGRNEVWIKHHDQMYRLRRTTSGKLYLCK